MGRGFRVEGLGCRVQGFKGLGFRVWECWFFCSTGFPYKTGFCGVVIGLL